MRSRPHRSQPHVEPPRPTPRREPRGSGTHPGPVAPGRRRSRYRRPRWPWRSTAARPGPRDSEGSGAAPGTETGGSFFREVREIASIRSNRVAAGVSSCRIAAATRSWISAVAAKASTASRKPVSPGLVQVAARDPLPEQGGDFPAPVRACIDDGEHGLLQSRVGSVEERNDLRSGQVAAVHLVERDQRPAADARAGIAQTREGRLAVGDLDDRVDQRVIQEAVVVSRQAVRSGRRLPRVA